MKKLILLLLVLALSTCTIFERDEYYWLSDRDKARIEELSPEYIEQAKLVYESINVARARELKRQADSFRFQQCYRNPNFIGCMAY